jgi:hypothetical protein
MAACTAGLFPFIPLAPRTPGLFGSAKFFTPCERMHREKARRFFCEATGAVTRDEPAAGPDGPVKPPEPADEPPLQATASTAVPAVTASSDARCQALM